MGCRVRFVDAHFLETVTKACHAAKLFPNTEVIGTDLSAIQPDQ